MSYSPAILKVLLEVLFFLNYRFNFTSSGQSVQTVFLLDSVLAGCMFLEICPFLLRCPICWHITVHSILL